MKTRFGASRLRPELFFDTWPLAPHHAQANLNRRLSIALAIPPSGQPPAKED